MVILDTIKKEHKNKVACNCCNGYIRAHNTTNISDDVVYGIVNCKQSLFIIIKFFCCFHCRAENKIKAIVLYNCNSCESNLHTKVLYAVL